MLAKVVSPNAASIVGAVILVLMGCWSLVQMLMQKEKDADGGRKAETVDKGSLSEQAWAEVAADSEAGTEPVMNDEPLKSAVFHLSFAVWGL